MRTASIGTPSGMVTTNRSISSNPKARKSGAEIHTLEAFGPGRVPAGLENRPAQSAPGPVTAHKHRPDVCGLGGGIQKTIIVLVVAVTHVEPAPTAPASARNDLPAGDEDEVRPVGHQHRI